MDFSVMSIISTSSGKSCLESGVPDTLSSGLSVRQISRFKIGKRLLCMSWNLHHDRESTPFDCYWNLSNLNLKDKVLIATVWDIAEVFFELHNPTDLCRQIRIKHFVPSFLLSPDTLNRFCNFARLYGWERETVMNLSNSSIHEFLVYFMFDSSFDSALQNEVNVVKTHDWQRKRETNPLHSIYDPTAFRRLIEKDVALLPCLVQDFLHLLVIKFTVYYVCKKKCSNMFSDLDPSEQIDVFTCYSEGSRRNRLTIPKKFKYVKTRLYEEWSKVFEDKNVAQQVYINAKKKNTDIIFLHRVTEATFLEVRSRLQEMFTIVPDAFPVGQKDTTVICTFNKTVNCGNRERIKWIDHNSFAIPCRTDDISYYVAGVSMRNSRDSSVIKTRVVDQLVRAIGKRTPAIIGGDLDVDLTAIDNPAAKAFMTNYNGINYKQESILASMANWRRTPLNCKLEKTNEPRKSLKEGIFASFPLVGDAVSDVRGWGENNPSDHPPVYQEIMLF